MEAHCYFDSPLGLLKMIAVEDGISHIGIVAPPEKVETVLVASAIERRHLEAAALWMEAYFGRRVLPKCPPLALQGTPFQKTVWQVLLTVPYGETVSYGAVARKVAALLGKKRMSPQAVGTACGKNPVLFMVPCHRVVASDGSIGGYSAGIEKKRALLALEAATVIENPRISISS